MPWGLGVLGGEGETFEEFGGTLCFTVCTETPFLCL